LIESGLIHFQSNTRGAKQQQEYPLPFMAYQSLDEWLHRLESLHPKAIDLGLGRVKKVFDTINPSCRKPFTITVAGTNGKGSCIALLEAILLAEGYRVGAYTSPHLLRYNERIRIDGTPLGDAPICESFERINDARADTSLSYFEFGTLAALDIFSRAEIDVQLLEVGLGGRLDAVNIVDPDIALITTIAIDHSDWLGKSREAIGREKAGIFRQNLPAVIGDPAPPRTILERAQTQRVRLSRTGADFGFEQMDKEWHWYGIGRTIRALPFPTLPGEHQLQNAAAVIQTLALVADERPVSETAIRQGLTSALLPGRFQIVPGKVPILLDVAHNPQAAEALALHLRVRFPRRRIVAVFSIMRDKDICGVIAQLKPLVAHWYVAPLAIARCAEESQIAQAFDDCTIDAVSHGFDHFPAAFSAAKLDAKEDDLIVIFGSFFLVSEYLSHYGPTP
jgi:dihydrofolate synthase / folylpolyglutamate synthase